MHEIVEFLNVEVLSHFKRDCICDFSCIFSLENVVTSVAE